MSSTLPHFPLLGVLLISLLVQAMSHYLKTMHHTSLIQAYLSHLESKSKTVCCIRISRHKAIMHQSYKTIQYLQDSQEPSRIKNTEFCRRPRYLDPSTIKGNLGCCNKCNAYFIICSLPHRSFVVRFQPPLLTSNSHASASMMFPS